MSHYRIRRDGIEFPVAGVHALEQLVLDGNLLPDERVWDPSLGRWLAASEVSCLQSSFEQRRQSLEARRLGLRVPIGPTPVGPSTERVASSSGPHEPSLESAPLDEEIEHTDPQPIPPATRRIDPENFVFDPGDLAEEEFDVVSPDELTPAEELLEPAPKRPDRAPKAKDAPVQPRSPTSSEELGLLIPFPTRPEPKNNGKGAGIIPPHLLNPNIGENPSVDALMLMSSQTRMPSKGKAPRLRRRVILGTLLLGGLGVLLVRSWVSYQAHQTFSPVEALGRGRELHVSTPPPKPPVQDPPVDTTTTPEQKSPATKASPYEAMINELRARLAQGIVPVESAEGLSTSLLVELSRLKVEVLSTRAPITEWTGKRKDIPKKASIEVMYHSPEGEIDRELCAIGLVVGKYLQHYDMELDRFEVTIVIDGKPPLLRSMNGLDARRLYMGQVAAERLLTGEDPPTP